MSKKQFVRSILAALATSTFCLALPAHAETYPSRPINLVVGYPAGGSLDLTARVLGEALSEYFKQSVVVENLGGAGGTIGAQKVARATPDGYTLFLGSTNEMVIASMINDSVRYDSQKDFTAIGVIAAQPLLLTASPATGTKTAADYLKNLKAAKPNQFNFGSSGIGTSLHLAGEMINESTGTKAEHIPYRGVTPLVTDLVNGQLNYGILVMSSGLPHVKSGKIVALGTTARERSAAAPDIPPLSETPGFEKVDITVWFSLYGPANMPADIVASLRKGLDAALTSETFRSKLEASGASVFAPGIDPVKFQAEQTEKFKHLVRLAGLERQ